MNIDSLRDIKTTAPTSVKKLSGSAAQQKKDTLRIAEKAKATISTRESITNNVDIITEQGEDLMLLLNKKIINLKHEISNPKTGRITPVTITVGKRESGDHTPIDMISDEINQIIQFRTIKKWGNHIELTPLFVTSESWIQPYMEFFTYEYQEFNYDPCICLWNDNIKGIVVYYLNGNDQLISISVTKWEDVRRICAGKQIVCMTRDCILKLSKGNYRFCEDLDADNPDVYMIDVNDLNPQKSIKRVITNDASVSIGIEKPNPDSLFFKPIQE